LQTSDALGAAAVQLGPRALGLGTQLNKAYGLSWGKAARFTAETFGLQATRATYCRASLRMAKKLEPTYEALIQATRKSPIVTPDETGWRAGGRRRWLWTFVGLTTTVYAIAAVALHAQGPGSLHGKWHEAARRRGPPGGGRGLSARL
jgi:hypothetical protein